MIELIDFKVCKAETWGMNSLTIKQGELTQWLLLGICWVRIVKPIRGCAF